MGGGHELGAAVCSDWDGRRAEALWEVGAGAVPEGRVCLSLSVIESRGADAIGSLEVKMDEGRSGERGDLGTGVDYDEDGDVIMSG